MIDLLIGSVVTIVSMLIGFCLGRVNTSIPTPDFKKQINQIFKKVVPPTDVGGVMRPTQRENFIRDNPRLAEEYDVMNRTLDEEVNK